MNTVAALAAEGLRINLVIPKDWRTFGVAGPARLQELIDFYQLNNAFELTELIHVPPTGLRLEKYSHGIIAPIWAMLARFDVVYTRNPLVAWVAAKAGLQVIFETYRVYQGFNTAVAKWLVHASQKENVAAIITHSAPSREGLINLGVAAEKVAVIHNGFNPELFRQSMTKQEARQSLGLVPDAKIACYTGRLDKEKGIEAFFDLAALTPEITYVLLGKSQQDGESWLANQIKEMNLTNIVGLPWVTISQLPPYLFASDVLLIPPTADPLQKHGKTVLPMKLFLYMASGVPILAPALPDIENVLNPENAVLVPPDKIAEAARQIRRIISDRKWSAGLAGQAESDSRNYTWQSRARKIIEFLGARLSARTDGAAAPGASNG